MSKKEYNAFEIDYTSGGSEPGDNEEITTNKDEENRRLIQAKAS